MTKVIRFFLFLLFCQVSYLASAQNLDVSLFDGKSKQAKSQLSEIRKIKKERITYIKKRKKAYKAMQDSLKRLSHDSITFPSDSLKHIENLRENLFIYTGELYDIDSISNWEESEYRAKNEALESSKALLSNNSYYKKYGFWSSQLKGHKAELKSFKDSLKQTKDMSNIERDYLIDKKRRELQKRYQKNLESMTNQLIPNQNLPSSNIAQNEFDQLDNVKQITKAPINKQAISEKAKQGGKDFFSEQQEALTGAMNKAQSLKKKYSKVIDSNNLSTATKRNSLKGQSTGERLIFGGTFQVHIDQTTAIDLNPELGYKLNKDFNIGLGGTYQINTNTEEFFNNLREKQVAGYRIFLEHKLFKSFYLHAEYEALNSLVETNNLSRSMWHKSFLAGIERRFKIQKNLEGQFSVLYNFSYSSNVLYNSPWTVRFGFNILQDKPSKSAMEK